jgi:diguanylate cyclase (GGDEF)-like protein
MAAAVVVLGVLTLVQYIAHADFGIDQLLWPDHATKKPASPGRMSPAAALCFTALGLSLMALKARSTKLRALAHWLVLPALLIASLSVLGYAYGVKSLYAIGLFTSLALHTALTLFLLALSISAADAEFGYAKLAGGETAGGLVVRRLLPALPLLLVALGWVRLEGQRLGFYAFEFGLALMVLSSIVVCTIAVVSTASILHKTDLERQDAVAGVIRINEGLEQQVKERTEKLADAVAALERLSLEDELTKIPNRRYFDLYAESQVAMARRSGSPLALIMFDVDVFKSYNDRYGHSAGDDCLKAVAAAIRSSCARATDMVARYGGEEFVMLLPDTDLDGATAVAEAARTAVVGLGIPNAALGVGRKVTISGGVAVLAGHSSGTVRPLIVAADQALYRAKTLGRNRIERATTRAGRRANARVADAA